MELRDIEIFLTLAEELHFGRSADAPPVQWGLVWRTDREPPLVRALARAVSG
ncbi:hypothetical protein ACWGRV_03200 [Streptomyces sp. NPDC055663]